LTIFHVSNFAPKSDSKQDPVTNDSPTLQHEFFNSQFKHNNIFLSQLQKIYTIKIYKIQNTKLQVGRHGERTCPHLAPDILHFFSVPIHRLSKKKLHYSDRNGSFDKVGPVRSRFADILRIFLTEIELYCQLKSKIEKLKEKKN